MTVLQLRVEDRGDERRRGPTADPGSGPGPGNMLGLIEVMEVVWRAATNGRTALNKWTLIARSDICVQGNATRSYVAWWLPLS